MKALGFPTTPLVLHYLKLVAVVVLLGSALGLAGGFAFGEAMIASYHGFFRLPVLVFELTPWSALVGFAISFAAASLGVVTALRNVVALAPAVAMRPAAPLRFRRSWIEGLLSAKGADAAARAGDPQFCRPSAAQRIDHRRHRASPCRWSCSGCSGATRSTR